jgi:hypothetical protein
MVTGKKEGFRRPPGPSCDVASMAAVNGVNTNAGCHSLCQLLDRGCTGGYYNATDDMCECFMKGEKQN